MKAASSDTVSVAGFQILEKLYESQNSAIYRARRSDEGDTVVLKILGHEYPTPEQVARFKREFEITRQLDHPHAIQAFNLLRAGNQPVIVLEDFGGESLIRNLLARKLTLKEFLSLAIRVTDILGSIHRQNIIHKDINPANIVWNPETDQVKIIDFGISTPLSRENPEVRNPEVLEGTLAYMSPEQTGRMNRAMDYRTDLYSLGATFYRMLTGRLPFDAEDPMELVHCHIAKLPVEPIKINREIPAPLSRMIMKLLAKTAEDRYQSAHGLKADLEECLARLRASGDGATIEDFVIGRRDASDRFQIPQKLYGRADEVQSLLAAYGRVNQGATELVLVTGYSGAGKSALVHEVQKPLVESRGYFISGKFDQLNRNKPYASLIQAFQELIRQILTESEQRVAMWRDKLLDRLRNNGQLIIDVIPEVELIIGPQQSVPELPPVESQNRFHFVFQSFVEIFADREHPLALFLDDLQWADPPSLKLVEQLLSDPSMKYMLLIGAYRSNEVEPTHPLQISIARVKEVGVTISTIKIKALDRDCVLQLVADTLKTDVETAAPLADLCLERTGGNPFFLNQFLNMLHEERLIEFNTESMSWHWDLEAIQRRGMTDNVIELMTGKIKKLAPETQNILKMAACVGNVFDLSTLSVVYEKSRADTARDLWEALQEGLVMPVDDSFKFVQELADRPVLYRFLHDRVQQAAYSLIAEEEAPALHLQIGRLLLDRADDVGSRNERIFDIVSHLNLGRSLIDDPVELERLSELNLAAGKRAKASAAYAPAFTYLRAGVELLGENRWQDAYVLTLNLYSEAAEAAYLSADFAEMERLSQEVLDNARKLLHRVKAHEIRILALVAKNEPAAAVKTALRVLRDLGIRFPAKPKMPHVLLGLLRTKLALRGRSVENLADLPAMSDPNILGAMRILASLSVPAYTTMPELVILLAFKTVQLSLKYGNTPLSTFGYALYGFILCGVTQEIDRGYRFGRLAMQLLEDFSARGMSSQTQTRTILAVNSLIRHWKEPYRESLDPSIAGYQVGVETGDLEYASYNAAMYCYFLWLTGRELHGVDEEMSKYRQRILQFKQRFPLYWLSIIQQSVRNMLRDDAEPAALLEGDAYSEEESLRAHLEANDRTTLYTLYFNKMVLAYHGGHFEQAFEYSENARRYMDGALSTPMIAPYYYYDSLLLLGRLHARGNEHRTWLRGRTLRRVRRNQRKLKRWAGAAPGNNLHKWHLVQAEYHRARGKYLDAVANYKDARRLSRAHDYLNDEALAHCLTAQFYEHHGEFKIARLYAEEAYYYYRKWGAEAMLRRLEREFPSLAGRVRGDASTQTAHGITSTAATSTGSEQQGSLDLGTVMKASLAISGEIVLDRLLEKLISIVIENAGAERGYLILDVKGTGDLMIQAEASVESGEIRIMESRPIENVPENIIYYVVRTKEDVVLDDASYDARFNKDPYIKERRTKSILCTPIVQTGRLLGVLYVENNLATGAFTPARVQVLRLLAAQAAVSLDNAILYENLEQQVEDRTAELNATLAGIKSDLATAQKIQSNILPRFDKIAGLRLHTKYLPMAEVGGDFFDVAEVRPGLIRIFVADATGHGIQAALMTMAIKGAYENFKDAVRDPAELMATLNNDFYQKYLSLNSYFTAIIVDVDRNTNTLSYCSAGHPTQILLSEGELKLMPHTGSMVGIMEGMRYKTRSFPFAELDRILLFSDGIFEQFDHDLVEYGEERLHERIGAWKDEGAGDIVDRVLKDVRRFMDGAPIQDDITVVGIEVD